MREARPETTADAIPSSTLLDTRCQSLVYSLGLYKNEAQNPGTSMGSKQQKDSLSSGHCHYWIVASWGISSEPDQCDGKSVCTNALSQWFTKDGNQVRASILPRNYLELRPHLRLCIRSPGGAALQSVLYQACYR